MPIIFKVNGGRPNKLTMTNCPRPSLVSVICLSFENLYFERSLSGRFTSMVSKVKMSISFWTKLMEPESNQWSTFLTLFWSRRAAVQKKTKLSGGLLPFYRRLLLSLSAACLPSCLFVFLFRACVESLWLFVSPTLLAASFVDLILLWFSLLRCWSLSKSLSSYLLTIQPFKLLPLSLHYCQTNFSLPLSIFHSSCF